MPEHQAIEVRGLSRTYRSALETTRALAPLDAEFPSGTLSAAVGRSGTGKSTLLRLLAGLEPADGGSIRIGTTEATRLGGRALRRFRRDRIAYVPQRAAAGLIPHLTLRRQLGADGLRHADMLHLGDHLDSVAHELSGGQQARAALAVALARNTEILLADEPTAELDSDTARLVVEALLGAARAGRTVVVATHDPELTAHAGSITVLGPDEPPQTAHEDHVPRSPGAPARIGTQGVGKSYGLVHALTDVTFGVAAGELAVVIGRSGSGKSTLLMILAGFLDADSGHVTTPGRAWHETAYLAQRFALLPELTIGENISLPGRLGGGAGAYPLEQLGLSGLADRYPHETSIGQQQRTALARALLAKPAALLADEPTSHQDTTSAGSIWRQLKQLRDEGTACLVATHDETAARHADRVWRIEDGAMHEA